MVQGKNKIITILALISIHLLPVNPQTIGFSASSPWWTHFVYMFFHANWLHLIMNIWAFYFVCKNLSIGTLLSGYLCSVAFSFLIQSQTPTVGFSSVIFYLLGIIYARVRNWKNWLIMIVIFMLGFCRASINGTLHLLCFLYPIMYFEIEKFKNDRKRITERKQTKER